jgi:hypothetical protein
MRDPRRDQPAPVDLRGRQTEVDFLGDAAVDREDLLGDIADGLPRGRHALLAKRLAVDDETLCGEACRREQARRRARVLRRGRRTGR